MSDAKKYVQVPLENLRAMRNEARNGDRDLKGQQRELSFLRAGINTQDPKTQYFVNGYDGELSEDAIRTAAIEVGLMVDPTVDAELQADLRMHQHMMNASAGADGDLTNEPTLIDKINKAQTPDEIMKLLTDANVPTTWNEQ